MPFVAKYQSGICPKCGRVMNPGDTLTVAGRGRPSRNGSGTRTYRHVNCTSPMQATARPTPPAIQREALMPTVAEVVAPMQDDEKVSSLANNILAIRREIEEMRAETAREIEEAKRAVIKSVVVTVSNGDRMHTIDVGLQHENFGLLCELMAGLDPADRNVWLTGPAGSGKTTAARKLAEALGLADRLYGR
jgi:flagellar biosynthesis GTPase FlhF